MGLFFAYGMRTNDSNDKEDVVNSWFMKLFGLLFYASVNIVDDMVMYMIIFIVLIVLLRLQNKTNQNFLVK